MAQHKLSLEIPDILNGCVLRIVDTSVYSDLMAVTCPRLQISVPGFSSSRFVDVEKDFTVNLSACALAIQTKQCGTVFNDLPDKVYVIRYSVAPNDVVYVEYNHLRISKALEKIRKQYCALDIGACAPTAEIKEQLDNLQELQNYLIAAKAKVEVCGQAAQGIQLYDYVWKKLLKLECKNC
jgi:hypothetical protein